MGKVMRQIKLGRSEPWLPNSVREPITKLEGDVLAARYSPDGKVRATYEAVAIQLGIKSARPYPRTAHTAAQVSTPSEQAYFIRCRAIHKLDATSKRLRTGDIIEDELLNDLSDFAGVYSIFSKHTG